MHQFPPATPKRIIRRHQSAEVVRQQFPAHDEAWTGGVDGAALFEEIPCCLGGTEDDGGGWAELEVDDVAVLGGEVVEPEPGFAEAGFDGFGARRQVVSVGV